MVGYMTRGDAPEFIQEGDDRVTFDPSAHEIDRSDRVINKIQGVLYILGKSKGIIYGCIIYKV